MEKINKRGEDMKICGFVKVRNESEKGNLERCLNNLKKYCTEIAVCDDSSDDNSQEIIKKYTEHLIVLPDEFDKELEHKQKLLDYVLKNIKPDWIVWIDGDEILEKRAVEGIPKLCKFGDIFNVDCFQFHEINLWRSQCWYRLDNRFNDLWKINLWKNNGNLKFDTSPGLHKPQHPQGLTRMLRTNLQLIHYGFSTAELITEKYKKYRDFGQTGWALNRLIDERTLQLAPCNLDWFDEKPKIEPQPRKISEEEWKKLVS